ncbi:hypothetical protein FRB95_013800 [Tulasnella sp. JGI-2019a]|nr:hypothetical protein FRB95_013800 [Tulasnella sp. JGI-2019a]
MIYTGGATAAAASSSGGEKKSMIGPIVGWIVRRLLPIYLHVIVDVFLYKKQQDEARNPGIRDNGRQSESLRRTPLTPCQALGIPHSTK